MTKDKKEACWVTAVIFTLIIAAAVMLSGCGSTGKAVAQSASGKNVNADGYVMLGKIETANPETVTPQGILVIGRVSYKSRKVAVPADQKVPNAGYFKATKTKSLFGTEETIIEYDFTAGSDADAQNTMNEFEKRKKEAETAFSEKNEAAKQIKNTSDNK